jgi:hypothetical protein
MHVYEYFQPAFHILYGYTLQLARMAYFELEKYRNRIPETCVGVSIFCSPLTVISFSCAYHQSPWRQIVASHRELHIIEARLKHIFSEPWETNFISSNRWMGGGDLCVCVCVCARARALSFTEVAPLTVCMCMYRTSKLIGTGVNLEKGSLDSVTLSLYTLISVDSLSHKGLLNLQGFTCTWSWPTQLYSGVCLEGLRNTTKLRGIVSQPILESFRPTRCFRFSQRCCWGCKSSGMLHRIDW